MKKLVVAVLMMIVGVLPVRALGKVENPHHTFCELDFQPDTYTIGLGYYYMFVDFFGAGASIGFMGDATQSDGALGGVYDIIYGDIDPYYSSRAFTNAAFYFQPSLYFRTPQLRFGSIVGLRASLRPWLRLNTNHYASDYIYRNGRDVEVRYRCRTFSIGARIGPDLHVGMMGFSLGYTISNMDIMREYKADGRGYTSKPAQGLYFEISCSF